MAEPRTDTEWQRWIDDHAPRLLLFARQKARCEADAQDLVQEAIVECWQRQGDGGPPPLPRVFATIHCRAIDLARREDRRLNREQTAAADDVRPWFDTAVEDRELSRVLHAALAELPAEQREVITLKVWGEMTFAETAEVLDIPANTAASRYRYGMSELRRVTKQVLT
jgi:RNA polymerase sigma factor (sigma-70 family)